MQNYFKRLTYANKNTKNKTEWYLLSLTNLNISRMMVNPLSFFGRHLCKIHTISIITSSLSTTRPSWNRSLVDRRRRNGTFNPLSLVGRHLWHIGIVIFIKRSLSRTRTRTSRDYNLLEDRRRKNTRLPSSLKREREPGHRLHIIAVQITVCLSQTLASVSLTLVSRIQVEPRDLLVIHTNIVKVTPGNVIPIATWRAHKDKKLFTGGVAPQNTTKRSTQIAKADLAILHSLVIPIVKTPHSLPSHLLQGPQTYHQSTQCASHPSIHRHPQDTPTSPSRTQASGPEARTH